MSKEKNISRKNFIKGCSATLGLLSLGLNASSAAMDPDVYPGNSSGSITPAASAIGTRRGSWVANPGSPANGNVPLVTPAAKGTVVIPDDAHSAVKQAASFLAADIEKISGYKPDIVNSAPANNVAIHLATIGDTGIPTAIIEKLNNKHEAYIIKTGSNEVWLVGSDFRGTAFAAYTLSELLGIDPLYHWTGYQPQKHAVLFLKATDFFAPPPVFKYRGFFHDDEDVLPRPFERSGYPLRIGDISMDWYQRYFETALRLGMNMVAPVCRVHRRYEIQKCASDWGLYFTSHHYDILLSNPFGIERYRLAEKRGVSTDWDWFKNKQNMLRYWRGGVEENKDINAIWPVGLRGTDDHAYEFPANTPADVQADVFREAIASQVAAVKSVARQKSPLYHFTMYTEMLEKYQQHPESFDVPEEVIIVWPDNDDGLMRSLPGSTGKWRHGVYYHLAYFGKGISKQGPHVISPARIAGEFKKIKAANATEFLLVNVSEMREHVMEMRMIAELCRDEAHYTDAEMDRQFTHWWTNEYFKATPNKLIEKIYDQYFDIFSSSDKVWFGTDMVKDALVALAAKLKGANFVPLKPARTAQLNTKLLKYKAVLADIATVQKELSREQQQFFYENLTLGLLMDYRPCQSADLLLKALNSDNEQARWQYINEAMVPLEQLETELLKAERTPFERWYGDTWIKHEHSPLSYHRAYRQLRQFINTRGNAPDLTATPTGHNISGAQLWNDYLEASAKIHPSY